MNTFKIIHEEMEMSEKRGLSKAELKTETPPATESQQYYMKKMEKLTSNRLAENLKLKKSARRTGLFLTGVVFSIYFYTMYAMKQEKFLDEDFNTVPGSLKTK